MTLETKPITWHYILVYWLSFKETVEQLEKLGMPSGFTGSQYYDESAGYYQIWTCSESSHSRTLLDLTIGHLSKKIVTITDFDEVLSQIGLEGIRYIANSSPAALAENIDAHVTQFFFI